MIFKDQESASGQSIIEILVALALLSGGLVCLLTLANFSLRNSIALKETTQAKFLAEEAIEAVRNFRDNTNWQTNGLGVLTASAPYYLQKSSSVPPQWQLVPGQEIINGFNRQVVFNQVARDANDNITESGGAPDLETKKIIATVWWKDKKVELVTYLANWKP